MTMKNTCQAKLQPSALCLAFPAQSRLPALGLCLQEFEVQIGTEPQPEQLEP